VGNHAIYPFLFFRLDFDFPQAIATGAFDGRNKVSLAGASHPHDNTGLDKKTKHVEK
jgi:hypothetical protein